MKNIYLISLFLLLKYNSFAQITLTSESNCPDINEKYEVTLAMGLPDNYWKQGTNITWDFSNISGDSMSINYSDIKSSSQYLKFTSSNIVEYNSPSPLIAENYYYKSETEYSITGHYIEDMARISYSDKREFIFYPITYGDSYNGTFSGVMEYLIYGDDEKLNRGGTVKIIADAYGTLKLPYVDVENVLRIKSIYDYQDTYEGVEFYSYKDTIYTWWEASSKRLIANVSVGYQGVSDFPESFFLYEGQTSYITDIGVDSNDSDDTEDTDNTDNTDNTANSVNDLNKYSYKIYPNPADEIINIEFDLANKSNGSIIIYNSIGALVKTLKINNTVGLKTETIDVKDLSNGLYYIKIKLGEKSSIKTISITK